jgi:uncharacterized LabA/DUF88 family protein
LSKNVAIFIDVANLYYSARGQDVDVDYVALLKHATKGRDLIRAYAYSGLDPENENQRKFLDFLSKNGYKVVHKDIRKFGDGRVKANLDIELVVDLFRLAPRMDIAVVISGDGDFASAIRALQDIGVRCEVISFRPNTSSDLIAVADEFTDIMKIIGIGRKKGEKGISMPEMPAKEVNPEFGFREASRGVAAAALAALREGEKPAGRSRGRGTSKPAEEAVAALPIGEEPAGVMSDEPVEPMTAVEAHVDGTNDETTRRRRRRRGGRGRGRGRRSEGQEESVVPGERAGGETDAEIGWQEFDDLSQLGLTDLGEPGGEREFTFEEADPETLVELGIEPKPVVASGESEVEVISEEPQAAATRSSGGRRRRRPASDDESGSADAGTTTTTRARASASGSRTGARTTGRGGKRTESAATGEVTPARARSRRSGSRAGARGAAEGADASEVAKPPASGSRASARSPRSPRASSRSQANPTADIGSAAEGGQGEPDGEEGIWQRFRSGRGPARSSR